MRLRVAAFVIASLVSAAAHAQDAGAADAATPTEAVPGPTEAPPPLNAPPLAPPSGAALPPIGAPPAVASPPEPAAASGFGPPDSDAWPIEYVLRPQTLPAHTWRAGVTSSLFLPDTSFRSPSGASFHRSATIGLGATFGVTNRLQLWFTFPRIVCISEGDVSGCSSYARFIGTGGGLDYGLVRTRTFQLALSGSLSLALSSPEVVAGTLEVDTKWLLAARVALTVDAWVYKWLGAPAFYSSEAIGSGGLSAYLNLQATHHLLLYAGATPNGPLDHLDEPRVTGSAGLSWTFDNGVELGAYGTTYEVVARRTWDQTIPGKAFGASLRSWL